MTQQQRAIGIFNDILNAEAALEELDKSHFSLDRVFVIARNTDKEQRIVGTELCESLRDRFDARINSAAQQDSHVVNGETVISLTRALSSSRYSCRYCTFL